MILKASYDGLGFVAHGVTLFAKKKKGKRTLAAMCV